MSLASLMNSVEHLNTIIHLAESGGFGPIGDGLGRRIFGGGDNGISFVGPNLNKYKESLKELYQTDKSVHDTYSLNGFESELIGFLRENISTKKLIGADECNLFFAKLLAVTIDEFSVLRDVHGLILKDSSQPFVLGPFTIYHFPTHQHIINSKTSLSSETLWTGEQPNYLIETTTKARHIDKAIEKADILFEKFELALRYAIGFDSYRFEVGVLNYQGWRHRRAYIFSRDGSASNSLSGHGSFELISIDDPYFSSADAGFDRMWETMTSSDITELQKRLLLAIEWIGQSYNEISPSSSFLKSAIALEILFTHNEKTLINSSILSQIAESIALILGRNLEERIKIESEVKKLYSMRSAIAHAGKTQVAQEDLFTIFHLSRAVVMKLMTNNSLRDLKSISAVHTYIKSCKFSCASL